MSDPNVGLTNEQIENLTGTKPQDPSKEPAKGESTTKVPRIQYEPTLDEVLADYGADGSQIVNEKA